MLPFSIARQTVVVKGSKDDDAAPALTLIFETPDADSAVSRLTILGQDGHDDVVLTFNRGGALIATDYRPQPEADDGAANEARNARDVERIRAAKEAVAAWDETDHAPNAREPDEMTRTLAAMELSDEPETPRVQPTPFGRKTDANQTEQANVEGKV